MSEFLDTKKVQSILLEDYKVLSDIWRIHCYNPVFTGGSVLGAVRHKGVIPWDDDLDVGLPRDEYEDFINNTSKELPDYLVLSWKARGQQYVISDTRYSIKLDEASQDTMLEDQDDIAHPSIDLQVFDGTPNNSLLRFLYCCKVFFYRVCIKMSSPDRIHTGKWRPRWENVLIIILKKISFLFPREEKIMKKYLKYRKKYSFHNSRYVADFVGKYHFKDVYPKAWWYPTIESPFEDINVPIPNGFDMYLRRLYGDYMTPPKSDDRIQHMV